MSAAALPARWEVLAALESHGWDFKGAAPELHMPAHRVRRLAWIYGIAKPADTTPVPFDPRAVRPIRPDGKGSELRQWIDGHGLRRFLERRRYGRARAWAAAEMVYAKPRPRRRVTTTT